MKSTIFAIIILSTGLTSMAAQPTKDLSVTQAQSLVIRRAHKYIDNNAPDFGGSVNSPCLKKPTVNSLKITCTGIANETTAGGGSVAINFECSGDFISGIAPLYTLAGHVSCKEM